MAVETPDFHAFLARGIRAAGRRVAAGEPADLADLLALQEVLDEAVTAAVEGLRSEDGGSYSWQAIAEELGTTRQAAMQRWPDAGGARRRGGQPTHLR